MDIRGGLGALADLNELKEAGGGSRDKGYEDTAEIVRSAMDDRPKETDKNKGPEGEERRR